MTRMEISFSAFCPYFRPLIRLDESDDPPEEVRVVVARHPLDHGGQALQPHSRIDVRFRQGGQRSRGIPVELGEDEVPDLEVAVAFAVDAAIGPAAARPLPLIVQDLGAGAAGTGLPHHPEVALLPHPDDPLRRDPHPAPDPEGLIVVGIDRDPEPLLGEPHDDGQVFPRPGDRLFLEVISEGKVPEHLEEGVVARRDADVLQVVVLPPCPDALLGGHRPPVPPVLQTEEGVLELHHPGIGKQERRIVLRDQGGTRNPCMRLSLEKRQETLPDLTPRHRHETRPPCPSTVFGK